jgi:hypothetical protein
MADATPTFYERARSGQEPRRVGRATSRREPDLTKAAQATRVLPARTDTNAGGNRMTMELEHVFTYHALLKPPVVMGAGPFGTRMFHEVTEGKVSGPKLTGTVLGGGGDWLLVGPDGLGRLDVRAQLQTDDGAAIYTTYTGILELNEAVQNALATGAGTDWGDQYFRSTPRFETGDERYQWLTQKVFLGRGRAYPGGGVEYEVFQVS